MTYVTAKPATDRELVLTRVLATAAERHSELRKECGHVS
jgi:hypothetical protein